MANTCVGKTTAGKGWICHSLARSPLLNWLGTGSKAQESIRPGRIVDSQLLYDRDALGFFGALRPP